jgi:hypothetical protein
VTEAQVAGPALDAIISAAELRPRIIEAIEQGMKR